MAAPTLTEGQAARSIRAQGKKNAGKNIKNVLLTPYKSTWPVVKPAEVEDILQKLKQTFKPLTLGRKKLPWVKGSNRKLKKMEIRRKRDQEEPEDKKQLRSQLVFGINAVTRELEKDNLRLVIVDRCASPQLLIKHLMALSSVRQCPVLCIPGLASAIGPMLKVSSLMALGFKVIKDDDLHTFDELVSFLSIKAPDIELPWLQGEETGTDMHQDNHDEETSWVPTILDGTSTEETSQMSTILGGTSTESDVNTDKGKQNDSCTTKPSTKTASATCAMDLSHLYILAKDSSLMKERQKVKWKDISQKSSRMTFGDEDFIAFTQPPEEEASVTEAATGTDLGRKRKLPSESNLQVVQEKRQKVEVPENKYISAQSAAVLTKKKKLQKKTKKEKVHEKHRKQKEKKREKANELKGTDQMIIPKYVSAQVGRMQGNVNRAQKR